MDLVFASNNAHKVKEINALLHPLGIQVKSLAEIGCSDDIPETADSIEGNAILKAQYISTKFGLNCFADDSGLEVEALNGEPGVYSARYAGEPKSDSNNIQKVLDGLKQKTNRKARFKTVIALSLNGKLHLFEGIIEGQITTKPRGNGGFGYDPVFVPNGYTLTFAEMTAEQKNNISHRALAVKKMQEFLNH